MALARLFTAHPRAVGETYPQHFRQAVSFGVTMLAGGLACVVHALLPFLFERTASRCVSQLHERMVRNRSGIKRVAVAREKSSAVSE